MKSLALCVIIRDESHYIAEWIAFHRLVGVAHFFVYDDSSVDGTQKVIARMNRGDITLHHHDEGWDVEANDGLHTDAGFHRAPQTRAFEHFRKNHPHETSWCAFIDVDEFLFHTTVDSLPTVLEDYEEHCGVMVPWVIFGSNGHQRRPDGLTIESYTRRAEFGQPDPWGRHVKPIVRMDVPHQWGPSGSHVPVFGARRCPVTEWRSSNPWAMLPAVPSTLGLRINHYYHRSHEEAAAKMVRGYHNIPANYPGAERMALHDRNEVVDETILRFLPALKRELGL